MAEPLCLGKICLSTLQVLCQSFLLSDIHPCAHESLQCPSLTSRNAHATDASNLSVRPHDSLREVECSIGRQGLLNLLLDEYPIFRIHQRQILFLCRRLASRIEPMDLKQLRRPILEPSRGKCPAACMGKPLSFREVELGLFVLVNVEINPDPIEHSSVRSPDRFGATEEPPVSTFRVTLARSIAIGELIVIPASIPWATAEWFVLSRTITRTNCRVLAIY